MSGKVVLKNRLLLQKGFWGWLGGFWNKQDRKNACHQLMPGQKVKKGGIEQAK